MNCLRCGYCCVHYPVAILKDADRGPSDKNLQMKEGGVRCPHLVGGVVGELECAIHNKKFYKDTPCFMHVQVERGSTHCRMGEYVMGMTEEQRWHFVFDPRRST
jgi:hypothetical protein